jgi:hypothetical protein
MEDMINLGVHFQQILAQSVLYFLPLVSFIHEQ